MIDLEFKNLRIREKKEGSGKGLISNNVFKALQSHILQNELSFELVMNFFNRNKNNSDDIENELKRIDDDVKEFEITGYTFDELQYVKRTKDLLKFIYQLSPNHFNEFRSDFTEYLGFTYLAVKSLTKNNYPKSYSRFFHEPYILYKKKRFIEGESIIDNVHINRKSKTLDFCECKANVNTFLGYLSQKEKQNQSPVIRKTIQNAHRKFEFMKKLKNKINVEFEECNCDMFFLTYIWDTPEIRKYNQFKDEMTFVCAQDIKKSFMLLKKMQTT